MNRFIRAMGVSVLILAGCEAPVDSKPAVTAIGEPLGPAATTTIGPAGGTARSADGQLELIVPAGALAADTVLSVTPLSVTAPGGVKAWRLGPEGTTFSQPATVKMSFTDREIGGSTTSAMRIAFQDSERRWVAYQSSTIDGNTIAVQTTHLSDWSNILGWQLRPQWPYMKAGETLKLSPQFCSFPTINEVYAHVAECGYEGVDRFFVNWAVNGIPGGNAEVGTVQGNATSRTYTAPSSVPEGSRRIAVSVDYIPQTKGDLKKFVLVSNVSVQDKAAFTYQGAVDYHLKLGGPGTSTLPLEYRMTAPLRFNLSSTGNYDLAEAQATLVSYRKENGITNCTCSASNVMGTIEANTGAFVFRNGAVEELQFSAIFTVPLICTGSTDPACANYTTVEAVPWALTGVNPGCTNMVDATYSDPNHINGTWKMVCAANPELRGRLEEMRWSLAADL